MDVSKDEKAYADHYQKGNSCAESPPFLNKLSKSQGEDDFKNAEHKKAQRLQPSERPERFIAYRFGKRVVPRSKAAAD